MAKGSNNSSAAKPAFGEYLATPGTRACYPSHSFPLELSSSKVTHLVLCPSHKNEVFSEYLLVDLKTYRGKSIVFESLREFDARQLVYHEKSNSHYVLDNDGIHLVNWKTGKHKTICSDGLPEGSLPALRCWQGKDQLWVLTQSARPSLFQIQFKAKVTLTHYADITPPEIVADSVIVPQKLQYSKRGKLWCHFRNAKHLVYFDPQGGILDFIDTADKPVHIDKERVYTQRGLFDADSGKTLKAKSKYPNESQHVPWISGMTSFGDEVFCLNEKKSKWENWGKLPPKHTSARKSRADQDNIQWTYANASDAYGFVTNCDPQVRLAKYSVKGRSMEVIDINVEACKPQVIQNMCVGPDDLVYGCNDSQTMWRVDPKAKRAQTLGWSVPSLASGRIGPMMSLGQQLYFTSYPDTWVSRYDPSRPWNPGTSKDANPKNLIRLITKAGNQNQPTGLVSGVDGRLYLTTMSANNYHHKSALAVIDPDKGKLVKVIHPLLKGFKLFRLCASKTRPELYISAFKGVSWLRPEESRLLVYDYRKEKITREFSFNETILHMCMVGDTLLGLLRLQWSIFRYDTKSSKLQTAEKADDKLCFSVSEMDDRRAMINLEGVPMSYEAKSGKVKPLIKPALPMKADHYQLGNDGYLYFTGPSGWDVQRLKPVK